MDTRAPEKRTILVAEDVTANRVLLKKIFSDEFIVEEARDGEEALEKLRSLPSVEILLLDIAMPKKDGFQVLAEMRDDPAIRGIPVIVASAYDDESAQIKAFDLGAEDVFSKPYNERILRSRVHNVLDKMESRTLRARVAHQAEMLRLAQRDALTGLYNRDAFCEFAGRAIAGKPAGTYTMACFDVDNFKVVNDQYGLEIGNRVLKNIAEFLDQSVQKSGAGLCCRMSADNFAVLFQCSAQLNINTLAAQQTVVFMQEGIHISIHLSCGQYLIDDRSLSVSAMIDRALLAKRSIKGLFNVQTAIFSEEMRRHMLEEQTIISQMEDALRNGEFVPWLQPQFDHANGSMYGAEALVRWIQNGVPISPAKFIPIFERNGFIYELDKNIWEQVCRLLRQWLDAGEDPLPVSVNISRYDILCPDFYEVITGLVKRYQIPVALLRLEVTESAFAQATHLLIAMVKRLKAYGFLIEIDDFGSGYSSFNTLKDVPADILKLDMRFLEKTEDIKRSNSILESIIRMAKWLDMPVIAEGVETREQADFLKSIGCCIIQGYFYAKPMPAEQYVALMRGNRKNLSSQPPLELVDGLDTKVFWDPKFIDEMIFSSYVGGVCVMEFSEDRCEMLRVNGKYLEVIRTKHTIPEVLTFDPMETLSLEDGKKLQAQVDASAETGQEFCGQMWKTLIHDAPVNSEFLRYIGRVIAKTPTRRIVYLLVENATEQQLAYQREVLTAEQLRQSNDQLRFLNRAAEKLLAESDCLCAIHRLLQDVQGYFTCARSYILEVSPEGDFLSNTYECCGEGVCSEKDRLQNVPMALMQPWVTAFEAHNHLRIESIDEIDSSRTEEKFILKAQGIRSLMAIPLRRNGRLIGALGIDDPTRHTANINHLNALGGYVTTLLARRDAARPSEASPL